MWKLIVVAEAPPLIVFVVARTCLMSRTTESFAPTATASASKTSFSERVKVPALDAVFVTTMFVTTVEVAEGTVYKVVEVVVVAAPRNKFFGVDGIR
jgi:hypothetical protein